jgi:hypothetical protein
MSIEKLTKRLQGSIDFALDNEEDLDAASWNYQEGILITVNEAKLLLEIVKNCSIPAVVGQSEQCDHDYSDGTGTGWNVCKKCGDMY